MLPDIASSAIRKMFSAYLKRVMLVARDNQRPSKPFGLFGNCPLWRCPLVLALVTSLSHPTLREGVIAQTLQGLVKRVHNSIITDDASVSESQEHDLALKEQGGE